MPFPTLQDDGAAVTLDLHGARVDEAVALAQSTLDLAARRGRHSVKLIHGSSTSDRSPTARSIKHALEQLLERDRPAAVTSVWQSDGHVVIGLDVGATPHPARLTLDDVWM